MGTPQHGAKAHAAAVRLRIKDIIKLRAAGLTVPQLAQRFGVSLFFMKTLLRVELRKTS